MNLNQTIINLEKQLDVIILDVKNVQHLGKDTGKYLKDVERKIQILKGLVDYKTV